MNSPERMVVLLFGVWCLLVVLTWLLVLASLAGLHINMDALDRIGAIWLVIVAAGVVQGARWLAARLRSSGV